jgi:hypothetical protein
LIIFSFNLGTYELNHLKGNCINYHFCKTLGNVLIYISNLNMKLNYIL